MVIDTSLAAATPPIGSIDEDSPTSTTSPSSYAANPFTTRPSHARTGSDATLIHHSASNPFQTPSTRSRASSAATTLAPPLDAETALRPDPGTEADFKVENNPFAFSPGQLNKLLNPKSLQAFRALGGLRGIEKGLQSDAASGLSVDETSARTTVSFAQAVQDTPKLEGKEFVAPVTGSSGPFADRVRVFGKNVLPAKKSTPYYKVSKPLTLSLGTGADKDIAHVESL